VNSGLGWRAVGLVAVLGVSSNAGAVPIFARKYQTSCQTCHVAYPKLTPFGDAFRRNGYRFPGSEEEDSRKEEPLPLGQQAHKGVFPNSVWPGEMPATAGVAARVGSQVVVARTATTNPVNFAGVGGTFGINFAASLGDMFAAWAGAVLMAQPLPAGGETVAVSLERVFVTVTPFERPVATLRVGRIEPTLFGFTMHRMLGAAPWLSASPIDDNQFTVDPAQLGLEAAGVLAGGRLAYSAGLVDGSGNQFNGAKDFYGRVAYKLGGMRLDGIGGATEAEPWRERSVQLGVFGYRGQATLGDPKVATQVDRFWLAGADLNLFFRDANLMVAFSTGMNERPSLAMPEDGVANWQLFSQLDYVVYPWLIPTARFEERHVGSASKRRLSGGSYFVIRANVRAQLLASFEAQGGGFKFGDLSGGLMVAF